MNWLNGSGSLGRWLTTTNGVRPTPRWTSSSAAAALEVSVAELLGSQPHTMRAKPGPVPQLERRIEQVKLLPRKKQQLIVEFLDAIISTEKA